MGGLKADARSWRAEDALPQVQEVPIAMAETFESSMVHPNTNIEMQTPFLTLNSHMEPTIPTSSIVESEIPASPSRIAAMGAGFPCSSQESLRSPPRSPAYTWERTSPINGRTSGMFVLHLGSTPQTSPMSRAPPNRIVNRKELRQAIQGNLSRARRGEGGVRRRLEGTLQRTTTNHSSRARKRQQVIRGNEAGGARGLGPFPQDANAGEVAGIFSTPQPCPRSPYILRHRVSSVGIALTPTIEDHGIVNICASTDAASLAVDACGGRSSFSDTFGPSFPSIVDGASNGTCFSVSEVEFQSEDDPDWEEGLEDIESLEGGEDATHEFEDTMDFEDPLQELGLYNPNEDVTTWPFEKKFGDDQWQDQSITLIHNTSNFSGPVPGPTSAVASRPVEYLLRFWPPHILQRVVDETNRYAAQPSHENVNVTNGRVEWTALDSEELLVWFGILILMGLKEFPHIRCYWDTKPFYNCPLISEAMPRNRFEAITRCLHLVNNDELVTDKEDPSYDKLGKVRWLCESFARMSQSLYNNERVLTVDEIMIAYKGRFCNIRQYMKSKPVKFGVKVWALANAQSRYVSNIIVYLGADDARTEGESVGEDAVLTAVRGLERRGHVIITDNFFTSPKLFMELLQRGFWATGTCRKTRKGFPVSLAGFSNTQLPERGHLVVKMHRSREISAICWMDAKPVFLLSTACDPIGEDSFAGRWVGRERVDFPTSPILLQYQAGMRGVDVVDQQRQEYSTQLHSHKWWHRLFMFVLDSQLLNAYILYAEDRRALGLPVLSRSLWHYNVGEELIKHAMIAGRIRGPMRNLARGGLHFISGHPTMRRQCIVCHRRTRRMCPGCGGLFQCQGACYRAVHTQHGYRA